MEFPSTNWMRQQSGSAEPQENSPAPSAAAFEQQLSEIGNSGSRALMPSPIHQLGASPSEAQPIMQGSGPEGAPALQSAGGGAMEAASALERSQSTGVLAGGSKRPVYPQDALIILRLEPALIKGGAAKRTAGNNVSNLLTLDRWLFENKKEAIASRLDDESLAADVAEFIGKGGTKKVHKALDHLRTAELSGGVVPIAGLAELTPYPEDAALIKEYKNEERTSTARNYSTALSRFSAYLREKKKRSITGRLSDKSLDEDIRAYKKGPVRDPQIGSALARLRKSRAGAQAIELERQVLPAPLKDAILMESPSVGGVAAQHSASELAIQWPEVLRAEGHDGDLASGTTDEASPSSSPETTSQDGASPEQTPLIMPGSAPEDTPASHRGDGGAMLGASVLQPRESTGVYVDGSMRPLYSDDASLIVGLEETIVGSNGEHLLSLARWLFANSRPGIAARLHDDSLSQDVEEFERSYGSSSVVTALALLRAPRSTEVAPPRVKRTVLNPYPDDAVLINQYKAAPAQGITQDTAKSYATLLADFSNYLRNKIKAGIAARLANRSLHELDKDVEGYKDSGGKRKIRTALAHFLKSPAAALTMGLERQLPSRPERAVVTQPRFAGDDATQHSASLGAVSGAAVLPTGGHDQNLSWEMMDEASSTLEPTAQLTASPPATQPIMQASAHEYTRASQERRGTMPGASALQPGQSPWAFAGLIGDPLYSRDAYLIEELRPALIKRGFKPRSIRDNVNALLRLGRWLLKNNKPEIAARLNHESLDEDTKAFDKTKNRSILTALGHLRVSKLESRSKPIASRADWNPYDDDAALIKEYKATVTTNRKTANKYATALSSFSEYLRKGNKPGFAARLFNKSLDEDVTSYRNEPGSNLKIRAALSHLRESAAGARAIELEGPAEQPGAAADGDESLGPFNGPRDNNHLLDELMGWSNLSPSEEVLINNEQDTPEVRPAERLGALKNSQGLPSEHQLSESDNLDGRVPQASAHDVDAALPEVRPTMHVSAYEYSTQSHAAGERIEFPTRSKGRSRRGPLADLGPSTRPIHPEDASFISGLKEAMVLANYRESTADANVRALRRLSHWLLLSEKPAINVRLEDKSLDQDAEKSGDRFIGIALAHLREFKSTRGIAPIAQRVKGTGKSAAQPSASHGPFSWPEELPPGEDDQDVPEEAFSWPEELAWESNHQMSLEPSAHERHAPDPSGAFHALNWDREHQQASGELLHGLDINNLPPGEEVLINYEQRTVEFTAAKRQRILSPQRLDTIWQSAGAVMPNAGAVDDSLYPGDADLIKKYKMKAATEGTSGTANIYASMLSEFSRYLRRNNKHGIDAQLNDPSLNELDQDARLYKEAGGYRAINAAVAHLRNGASKRIPAPFYVADASLIAGLEPVLIDAGYEANTAKTQYVRPLRRFSQWLFANNKSGLAARLNEESIDNDAAEFEKGRKKRALPTALDRLRNSQSEGGIAWITVRLRDVESVAPEHNWPEELPPEGDDQDLLGEIEEESRPYERTTFEQTQEVEQVRRSESRSSSTWSPQMPFDLDWSLWQAWETAPSLPIAAQSPSIPHELRDDAHYALPRTPPSGAPAGTWDPTASIYGSSGRVLEDLEWLGDEHIRADYALLVQELQRDNPDLAARSRFVEPATAHLLRRTLNEDVLLENLQGIVNDQNGNDTARFVFMPVNDDEENGGRHWSLLLLDRGAPEGPVAYHYDSAGGRNHTYAAKLAEVLHARLEQSRMAQQQNSCDCGVYVVDGTRELVSQLSQGQRPELLNLDNLVADRRALQYRLRANRRTANGRSQFAM
ncbi:Ulp1 family isopeptidase [Bradyrhizobium manausense]|nr:Ulp1 family isopeptidase [Bradyrhizobium manausense]